MSVKTVLVTAAAGDQGRAITQALIASGHSVVALDTLEPTNPTARQIIETGARYLQGDLTSTESVDAALDGVTAVVSVPVGPPGDELAKVDIVTHLIERAVHAGIDTFVQTTTAASEYHIGVGDFGTGFSSDNYGLARLRIEAQLRKSPLSHWTVLRPVALMENLLPPKAQGMFPWLADGKLDTVHDPAIPAQLVTVDDIGSFAAAAVSDPTRFNRQVIELNGETILFSEVAEVLSGALGKRIPYRHLGVMDAIAAGMRPGVAHSQEWANRVGYQVASPQHIEQAWGIRMTTFAEFARKNSTLFKVGESK